MAVRNITPRDFRTEPRHPCEGKVRTIGRCGILRGTIIEADGSPGNTRMFSGLARLGTGGFPSVRAGHIGAAYGRQTVFYVKWVRNVRSTACLPGLRTGGQSRCYP
ncbi:hypothetical protein LY78DRAFT_108309 [Colletotrichum sublineola]|nr:hypothetical protein LY78DRAFT_108309 [Colletotrichum sublineola]